MMPNNDPFFNFRKKKKRGEVMLWHALRVIHPTDFSIVFIENQLCFDLFFLLKNICKITNFLIC